MKSITKSTAGLIIGVVVIVATIVVFVFGDMAKPKGSIDILGLIFILVSEVLLFTSIHVLNISKETRHSVFIKSGLISTLVLYWIVTTLFYILVKGFYISNMGGFLTVNIIFLAITSITCILIFAVYNKVRESNINTLNNVSAIKNIENKAKLLCDNVKYRRYKNELNKMYEDIKYCDNTIMLDADTELADRLFELEKKLISAEEIEENTIYEAIDEITLTVKKRNLTALENHKAGI